MRASTKGQIQIGETVAVIIVFMILLVFGLFWFSQAGQGEAEKDITAQQQLQLIEKTRMLMNLPEIQCSIAGKTDSTCIDYYRIQAYQKLTEDTVTDTDFRDGQRSKFFSYSAEITIIYPENNAWGDTIELFNYGFAGQEGGTRTNTIPVVVLDPITGKKYFSMLTLTQHREK